MRRFLALFLCISLAVFPVRAAEPVKYVALTFDDGPSGRFTRRLLDGLKERNARATFFLCGYRLETGGDLPRRILEEGHEIGLHGYSHRDLSAMTRSAIAGEITATRALLPGTCRPLWLRPPGGCCSDALKQVCGSAGLAILEWSVDPRDWATRDTAAVGQSVLNWIRDGDVVLLHDMSDSSVDAALAVVDTLQRQGYRFVTVSRLAALRGITPTPGRVYSRFPPGN